MEPNANGVRLPDWSDEESVRHWFNWLTRIGAGVRFGGRPIGWYQMHQVAATEAIERRIHGSKSEAALRAKGGDIEQHVPGRGWVRLASVREIFDEADRGARKNPGRSGGTYAVDLHYVGAPSKSVVTHELEEALDVVRFETKYTSELADARGLLWDRSSRAWRYTATVEPPVDKAARSVVLRHAAASKPLLHLVYTGPGGLWVLEA